MSTERAPGLGTVIFVSTLTSAIVSTATVFGLGVGGSLVHAETDVPTLVGLAPDAARGVLEARSLRLVVRDERHDRDAREGEILEQQPRPGSRIEKGSEVTVVLSLGPAPVEVPAVVGQPLSEARARLETVGLVLGQVSEGGEGPPGTVASASPGEGTRLSVGGRVDLVVVPEPTRIAVPEVTGISARRARTAITEAGLSVGRVRYRFNGDRPAFIVLGQSPEAGSEVDPGQAVDLVVNEE